MSSSKKKILRKAELMDGEAVHQKPGISGKGKLMILIATGIIAILIIFLVMLSMGVLHRSTTALSVGPLKISAAEYNFNYFSSVSSYVSNLTNYGITAEQMQLDVTKPLDQQPCPVGEEGETWGDFFREQVESSLRQTGELYLEAEAAGYTLPEESKKSIDDSISQLKEYCDSSNISLNRYLTKNYGEGVNEAVVRTALERIYLVSYYGTEKNESYTFTNDEVQKYYNENKSDFDMVDFRSFAISGTPAEDTAPDAAEDTDAENPDDDQASADEDNTAATEKAMAEAKQKADKMLASVTDEASFISLALENAAEDEKETYKKPEATLMTGTYSSQLSEDLSKWLFDDARKKGDKAVIASDTGYTVVYMLSRYRSPSSTVNVRHILIKPEVPEGTAATDEQKSAAKTTAEQIYNEWKGGGMTEDSFAELAKQKSTDPGSAENGGLYENVYNGQMTTEFNNWCFDTSRKSGDSGIVETEYGYHIMYFSGKGDDYWTVQVRNTLVSNAFDDYLATLEQKYPLKKHSFGMDMTGKL